MLSRWGVTTGGFFVSENMHELVKIESRLIGGNPNQTVNMRDLHAYVESKQDFSTWAKARLVEAMADEGVDFTLHKFVERRITRTDYHVTLDTAKHVGMLERNAKGKEIRDFFIEAEKRDRASREYSTSNPMVAELLERVRQLELAATNQVIVKLTVPANEYGELSEDGRPRVGLRRACFTVAGREKQAVELSFEMGRRDQLMLNFDGPGGSPQMTLTAG